MITNEKNKSKTQQTMQGKKGTTKTNRGRK